MMHRRQIQPDQDVISPRASSRVTPWGRHAARGSPSDIGA